MTFGARLAKLHPMNTPTTQADKLAAVPEAERAPAAQQADALIKDLTKRAAQVLPWLPEAEDMLWNPL